VKRRNLVLTVIAGLIVFTGVLVLYLPASWFAFALPATLKCSELGGSVWSGECLGLEFEGSRLGDATWNLAPARALMGRLAGTVGVRGAELDVHADVDFDFKGRGELRNVAARIPLDPALIAQFPRDQRGNVVADLKRVVIGENLALTLMQGVIELRDFKQVGARPLELGSYRLTMDGVPLANGASIGQLRDIDGPFAVEGTVMLTPPDAYLVQGYIRGRGADAERLVREITLGAPTDSAGRSDFSFEGTF
jgi:hypothetical protein